MAIKYFYDFISALGCFYVHMKEISFHNESWWVWKKYQFLFFSSKKQHYLSKVNVVSFCLEINCLNHTIVTCILCMVHSLSKWYTVFRSFLFAKKAHSPMYLHETGMKFNCQKNLAKNSNLPLMTFWFVFSFKSS